VTGDLVAFLRARYDDEARAATAATPGPWWHNPSKQWLGPEEFEAYDRTMGEEFVGYGGPHPFTGCIAATGPADNPQSMADAAHIARWHPARVLAEVDAKRRIVDRLDYWETAASRAGVAGLSNFERGTRAELLATCRLLALPYADHPDYQPAWVPEV